MLGRTPHLEVPHRAVVAHLAVFLTGGAWLYVGFLFIATSLLNQQVLQSLDATLRGGVQSAILAYLRNGEAQLPKVVSRLQREGRLVSCAVVAGNGRILAHTRRSLVGRNYVAPRGDPVYWGPRRGLRFRGSDGRYLREHREPLAVHGREIGQLHMVVAESSLWDAIKATSGYAPLLLAGPIVCLLFGARSLHRAVGPLDAVERQLRSAALARTLDDVVLEPVPATTAPAVGWNRVIERFSQRQGGALEARLNSAVKSLRQEKSDEVLNSMAEGVAVTDREGGITFANQALAALFSTTGDAESLLTCNMEQVLGLGGGGDAAGALTRQQLRGRHVVQEIKRTSGGAEQCLRVARSPLRSAERAAGVGHVWSVRDVTQQKIAEEARNQFLDSATHELRTPLANIKAYAETLSMSEMLDVESQKEFCNTINTEATRLARFIDDLLSISSMEVGSLALNKQGVELDRLFEEVVRKVKPQLDQKQITFDVIVPDKYPQMKLDKDKIIVALINLLGNAAKYTPEQGRVALKVKHTSDDLVVEVEDSGVGISPEELSSVFDKFFRSQNPAVQRQTGTGLGLSMAHEVIRLHGGDLAVRSELGAGSTFTVTLPVTPAGGTPARGVSS